MSGGRAGVPFGGHSFPYAPGTLRPSGDPAAADRRVLEHYRLWKSHFVRPRGDGSCAVYAPDAAYPYVAEAQGYGMVISALMAGADPDARDVFDGILRYVLAHPSAGHPDLHAAQQDDAGRDVGGANSATDGDLDIAYGLLLADRQWGGGYRARAVRRIDAIRETALPAAGGPIELGDWSSGHFDEVSRTSDWIPGHFRAFRAATGDPRWGEALDAICRWRGPCSGCSPRTPGCCRTSWWMRSDPSRRRGRCWRAGTTVTTTGTPAATPGGSGRTRW